MATTWSHLVPAGHNWHQLVTIATSCTQSPSKIAKSIGLTEWSNRILQYSAIHPLCRNVLLQLSQKLRGSARAVGSYSSSPPAGEFTQIIILKTLRHSAVLIILHEIFRYVLELPCKMPTKFWSLTFLALLLDLQLLDEHRLDLLGHHLELGVVVNA